MSKKKTKKQEATIMPPKPKPIPKTGELEDTANPEVFRDKSTGELYAIEKSVFGIAGLKKLNKRK